MAKVSTNLSLDADLKREAQELYADLDGLHEADVLEPIRTTGVLSDETVAALEAAMLSTSLSFIPSAEITIAVMFTSQAKPSGKSGLMERSIKREDKVSFLLGLDSLLKNPPGILPAA